MPTQPQFFRDRYERCDWIFDLFAYGFDFLNGRFFPPKLEAQDADWDREDEDVRKRNLVEAIVRADGQIPVELHRYLRLPGDDAGVEGSEFCLRLYCALSAIDRAAAELNYFATFANPSADRWVKGADHLEKHLRQLHRSAEGHVVFRPRDFEIGDKTWYGRTLAHRSWKEMPTRGEDLRDYFKNLLRIDASTDCDVHIHRIGPAQDVEMDRAELRVGIVPLVEILKVNASDAQLQPGPLRLVKEPVAPPAFGIHVDPPKDPARPCEELCDRAGAALRYLAERGAEIVLFPEMVVPDPVLARLREVLYELTDSNKKSPALILAGTFSRDSKGHSSSVPFNVAIALNHRGEELWRQSKLQPYEMKQHEQERFGLEKILGSASCREHMTFFPRLLQFVDSRRTGMRMVTLICEDATRAPGLTKARDFRANLILVPVMAGPLTNECGFAVSLDPVLNDYDAVFVVANSGALARAAWKQPTNPPLGILGVPLVSLANEFKTHKLLHEATPVPGSAGLEVLYYQLPEA